MEVPEFFQGGYTHAGNTQFTPERRHSDEHFIVEDLLDFSNEDIAIGGGDETVDNITGNSTDSSAITVVDSCKSSFSGSEPNFSGDVNYNNFPDSQFEGELCVPYDDLAELEWLSNFVEESFSTDDLQKLQLYSGMKAQPEQVSQNREFQPEPNRSTNITTANNPIFTSDISVPGKARSKRSRAAPCNWSSRLLVLTPSPTTSSSESDIPSNSGKKLIKATPRKKEMMDGSNGDGRKCLHCATDKTPQWRTGPLGPKTLCNACGVRYKSGRLVPEYRPAASPTFVLTQHSNSHRKVLELRRQKEMHRSPFGNHHHHHHHQYLHHNNMFNVSNADDYLIHHHSGPNYRQLI